MQPRLAHVLHRWYVLLTVTTLSALQQQVAAQELRIETGTEAEVTAVCRALVPGWSVASGPPELVLTPLIGGITNLLWRVDAQPADWCANTVTTDTAGGQQDQPHCTVLVRRYGDGSEKLIDRVRETAVLQALSASGMDVALLASFGNGRVEKWLDGWKALTMDQLRDPVVSIKVAEQVALLHDKTGLESTVPGISPDRPALWRQMSEWLSKATQLKFEEDGGKAAAVAELGLSRLLGELERLKHEFGDLVAARHDHIDLVRFGHNDLLAGNIMIKQEDVILIDFEYSDYNFRAFDIGNHFHEWAGTDCEWDELPSVAVQKDFIRQYLGLQNESENNQAEGSIGWPLEAEHFYREVQLLGWASNLYWGAWAVLQAKYSSIEFDYLQYAACRLERFRSAKAAVYAAVKAPWAQLPPSGRRDEL